MTVTGPERNYILIKGGKIGGQEKLSFPAPIHKGSLTAAELLRLDIAVLKKAADWLHDYGRPERVDPADYGDDFSMTYEDCDMVEKTLRLAVHNITMVALDLELHADPKLPPNACRRVSVNPVNAGGDDAG